MKESIEVDVKMSNTGEIFITTYNVICEDLMSHGNHVDSVFLREEDANKHLKRCPADKHNAYYVEEDSLIISLGG